MKRGMKLVCAALAAIACIACAQAANAATITLLGDSGSVRVITGTFASSSSIVAPYGTPPAPAITQTSATSYQIDFVPTADFFASAFAQPTGQATIMDGKIDFYVAFDAPVNLTTNTYEFGVWSANGTGTVNVTGGVVVSAVDPVTHAPLGATLSHSFSSPTFNANGSWSLVDQLTGFSDTYTTYKVSIDNALIAQALLPAPTADGIAYIAKKEFSLILTTDGSGGPNTPEPASLSLLALGGMALMARRRRA